MICKQVKRFFALFRCVDNAKAILMDDNDGDVVVAVVGKISF